MQVIKFIWAPAVLLLAINCRANNLPDLSPDINPSVRPTLEAYTISRKLILDQELSDGFGGSMQLTAEELVANEIIMTEKRKEYAEGLRNPELFYPSQHFFKSLERIEKSTIFNLISNMPKGGVLHAHDTALCSTKCVINLTYREDLWMCENSVNQKPVQFKFSKMSPLPQNEINCSWKLLSEVRNESGSEIVDERLREELTLYSVRNFSNANEVWKKFQGIFTLINGLLFYAPVWGEYFYKSLQEFQADGVQYLEFRSTLPSLYDLEGTTYTAVDTVRIYTEVLEKFMKENPDFIGSKVIYAPHRSAGKCTFKKYIATCLEIVEKFPDFVAGFDLVGQEELGHPLKDFVQELLNMPPHIQLYFHAGETNWAGTSVDENLVDAVLLKSKRIGHAFALNKHPSVLKYVRQQNIAIEVTPISNQVLMLVTDLRNHPLAIFLANNDRVVISSDDPSFFMATPLTHDFTVAFLATSAHADLKTLKQLIFNSINFSSLNMSERKVALTKWQRKWNDYIVKDFKTTPKRKCEKAN